MAIKTDQNPCCDRTVGNQPSYRRSSRGDPAIGSGRSRTHFKAAWAGSCGLSRWIASVDRLIGWIDDPQARSGPSAIGDRAAPSPLPLSQTRLDPDFCGACDPHETSANPKPRARFADFANH